MKKILSAITAVSILAASSAGMSVSAFTGSRLPAVFDAASTTPTATPSASPAAATATPTAVPTTAPTATPTAKPTEAPTTAPTAKPTEAPTAEPTEAPTAVPTTTPTASPVKITGMTLNKQNLTLKKGESFMLQAKTEPAEAAAEDIIWSTTSEAVRIADDGTVTAVSAGDAIVSAMTSGSRIVASCFISVEEENGILALSVSEGVKEVVITKNGLSREVSAGENAVEAGTYTVSAKNEENYTLNEFSDTVTIEKDKSTTLAVTANKTQYSITLPKVTGVTVSAIGGSKETVAPGGSYSFTISTGAGYDANGMTVKANGSVLSAKDGVYTINNITDDVIITIDGVESKSWDTSLSYVKVKGVEAVLGANDTYSVTIPYGETVKTSDIDVDTTDVKAAYTITTVNNEYTITVKAEDGTTKVYKLSVKNAAATEIDNFKVELNELKLGNIIQRSNGEYSSQDEAKDTLADKLEEIGKKYPSVSYGIENGEVKEPVKGTLSAPTGTDGYYKFKVTLAEGEQTREIELTMDITSYDYLVASSNITATATTITVRNVDSSSELALFTSQGGRLRKWTAPTDNSITFTNLSGGSTYTVKIRAAGSSDVPSVGTTVTTMESSNRGPSTYHTVYFDAGDHGTIVSGKAKQTVGNTRVADYPTVKADNGYIFKGWSSNGVLVEDPKTYYIRSTTSFIAVYEQASGSAYSSSTGTSYGSSSSVTAPAQNSTYTFGDVAQNSWYYNSVSSICRKGYMNGTVNGRFEPDAPLTRAMLVTILYRYACEPNVYSAGTFSDVQAGTWYSDAVNWAADAGIVNGTTANLFEPDANITREQLAAIIYRYSQAFGYDTSAAGSIVSYKDSALISSWAQPALIWTTGAGIISGKDGNILDPQGNATRAEAAAMIERFDNTIEGEI